MDSSSPPPALPGHDAQPLAVFLIPLGPSRHELYCERQHDGPEEPPSPGYFGALRQRFSVMLRAAEEGQDVAAGSSGVFAWLQARMLPWVAARVAEQRLLWNLRGCDVVLVSYPDDLSFDDVMPIVKQSLHADYVRHRLWLVVDTVLLVLSGILALVPGPNVIAYYFAFRVVGHWLSMRGASHGLARATWTGRALPALTALRAAVARPPQERDRLVEPLARELGLARLSTFLDRMLIRRP